MLNEKSLKLTLNKPMSGNFRRNPCVEPSMPAGRRTPQAQRFAPFFLSACVVSSGFAADHAASCTQTTPTPATATKPSTPTYATDIAPLIMRSCTECHRAGGVAPFSLETSDDLTRRAKNILRVIRDGTMPPWFAEMPDGSPHQFKNDPSLTDHEKELIARWLESSDRPLGDATKLPTPRGPAPEWQIGKPDLVMELPREVEIKASGTMPYVNLRVSPGFTEDRWVRAWEVAPTARDVVHHVLVFAVPKGARGPADESRGFFAAYVPGNGSKIYDATRAKRLPAGHDLVFQLHYTPNGRATVDRTRLGLVFAEKPPEREVRTAGIFDPKLDIPPGAADHREGAALTVPFDARILAWMPHMHNRGKSFRAYRELPNSSDASPNESSAKSSDKSLDAARELVLHVPRYDFNWQLAYEYEKPLEVKRGTVLSIEAVFDNSAENSANPDPTKRVRWGQQTTDEMLIGYIEFELLSDAVGETTTLGGQPRGIRRDRAAQFAFLDDDGDGVIEKGEGGVLVARAFKSADADNDGRITRAEFDAYLAKRGRDE
jgi:hypothetical protein